MIKAFPTVSEANAWMEQNLAWKAVTIMPGVSSGSLVMLFESNHGAKTIREVQESTMLAPKRRGRPPKVKVCQP